MYSGRQTEGVADRLLADLRHPQAGGRDVRHPLEIVDEVLHGR
jgi:hypothetical protein